MSERLYDEDEVAEIFDLATQADAEAPRGTAPAPDATGRGLTLREVKQIAAEVGISAELVERSAQAVGAPSSPAHVNRRVLGLPLGVAAEAPLARPLTDHEWEQIVAMARDEFGAHGKVETLGSLRSWRNGNLRVQLQPTPDGQRIRLETFRRQSASLMTAGGIMAGTGVALTTAASLGLGVGGNVGALILIGAGMFGAGAAGLIGWVPKRMRQMEAIAERARQLASRTVPAVESPQQIRGNADRGLVTDGD